MLKHNQCKEPIKKLYETFAYAEKIVKRIERENSQVIIPSINELRYAGFHILNAINTSDINVFNDEVKKAENHCLRALYDAIETSILFQMEKIKDFQSNYRFKSEVTQALPDYVELLGKIQKTQETILAAKKDYENRQKHYKRLIPHYKTIKEIANKLDKATPLINDHIKENEKWKNIAIIGIVIGIVGTTFGIVSIF